MTNKSILLLINIILITIFFQSCLNDDSSNSTESNSNNEMVLRIGDDDNMDRVLFDNVKQNEHQEVYKFQEQVFENSNYIWKDFWSIDDFSKEEYDEMKNYSTFEMYFEKVLHNSSTARKYTWKRIK